MGKYKSLKFTVFYCLVPYNIVTCISDYRQGLDGMIGFIGTFYIQLGTTGNYSAVAELHPLQFTVTHALEFSVFTSHILATYLSQSHCNYKITCEAFLSPNSFLAISSR
jgi:hypothetical protein